MAFSRAMLNVPLAAAIALLGCASAASAATAEFTATRAAGADAAPTNGEVGAHAAVLVAANLRETNLRKTATSIFVTGIEGIGPRRTHK